MNSRSEMKRIETQKPGSLILEIERLREALKFYADPNNYTISISGYCAMFDDAENFPKNPRFGIKARAALGETPEPPEPVEVFKEEKEIDRG